MLNKLVKNRNLILIVCAIIALAFSVLTFVFGNGDDKVKDLVLSLVLALVYYGFVRLAFKMVRIKAPLKYMELAVIVFLIFSVFSVVVDVINFITAFPNGLSPTLTSIMGTIIALLDEARKNAEMEENQK